MVGLRGVPTRLDRMPEKPLFFLVLLASLPSSLYLWRGLRVPLALVMSSILLPVAAKEVESRTFGLAMAGL